MAIYEDTALAQFENVNSLRFYPFENEASFIDSEGKELSRDVVVDLHMVVPADVAALKTDDGCMSESPTPRVRLASVHLSPYMVSACFRSEIDGRVDALSVTVARGNFEPYRPYRLEKLSGVEDMGGIVTFGAIDFPGFPETYFLDGAYVHPCCISAAKPAMLRSFYDPRSGKRVSGDVRLEFSNHIVASRDGKSVMLSLEDGSAEELASECDKTTGAELCGATPITRINGVSPDEDGNIVLWFH